MNLLEDEQTALWLEESWDQELEWDQGNIYKLSKHSLTVEDIEELFENETVFAGRIQPSETTKWEGDESRWLSIGKCQSGRFVTVVWTIRNGLIRCISARSARQKEREIYEQATKG